MLRISTRFALTLATLLFGLLFVTPAALAQGQDCPPEPASNTPIDDGEVFAGPNCTLQSPGDVDSFIFAAYSGQTFHMAVAINGSAPTNICLTLYDPNAVQIFSGCSSVGYPRYQNSVVNDQVLTVTGTYTIAITETGSGTLNYGVALDRFKRVHFPKCYHGHGKGVRHASRQRQPKPVYDCIFARRHPSANQVHQYRVSKLRIHHPNRLHAD